MTLSVKKRKEVLGVSSGKTKDNKETWRWNEVVQDCAKRKRLAKARAYGELLDTKGEEKDSYRLARQRNRAAKDIQQVRATRNANGNVLSEQAVGLYDIPVEVWRCLEDVAVVFLTRLFNRILKGEKIPEEWKRSILVRIFKKKEDAQSTKYRGMKLLSHSLKIWERVGEARQRAQYREDRKGLHCLSVDLKKVGDKEPRDELWYGMRKSGMNEKYVSIVQDMNENSLKTVGFAVGTTEWFSVEVELHQGSALSTFLFAMIVDRIAGGIKHETP
ncbi:uncharacterized protein LOC122252736 [Penaeus japonicus]|uniref:uncharacterized protein LOC122252736 n=1 Tax=Penaeus japonicus TaxID=27405 RepID=UPI001C7162CF|nr:uncharacterized protein LOC122252736 [Penaeus japonicus]